MNRQARVERIARTALRTHEDRFHNSVYERLSPTARKRLDALLRPEKDADNDATQDQEDATGSAPAVLLKLRGSPGRPSLASMQDELAKLEPRQALVVTFRYFLGMTVVEVA